MITLKAQKKISPRSVLPVEKVELPRKTWQPKRLAAHTPEPGAGNGQIARHIWPEGTMFCCGSCWGDGWVHVDEGTLILFRGLLIPVGICPRCAGSGRVKA